MGEFIPRIKIWVVLNWFMFNREVNIEETTQVEFTEISK